MDFLKLYAQGLKYLIAMQAAAPKAIEIIQHMGDDVAELIELSRTVTGAAAPQLALEGMPEPNEEVLALEGQLAGVAGTDGSRLDFSKLRDAVKRLIDSGMVEKLLPLLLGLVGAKNVEV